MDLADKKLGKSGDVEFKVEGGKVKLAIVWAEGPTAASLSAEVDPEYFLNKLAAAIPGKLDDAVIELLKGALKGL